jgi:hypothetical protein
MGGSTNENDASLLVDEAEEEFVAWEASSSSPLVAMRKSRDVTVTDVGYDPEVPTGQKPNLKPENVNDADPAMELFDRYHAAMPSSSPLPTWPAANEFGSADRNLRRIESCVIARETPVKRHVMSNARMRQLCSPGVLNRTLRAGNRSQNIKITGQRQDQKSAHVAELISLAGTLSREGSAAPASAKFEKQLASPGSSPPRVTAGSIKQALLPSDELDDDIDLTELASIEKVSTLLLYCWSVPRNTAEFELTIVTRCMCTTGRSSESTKQDDVSASWI